VVLSHAFWQRAFGGDPTIIGRGITVNQSPVRVIGVLPRGAGYPSWANLWRPIGAIINTDATLKSRNLHSDGRIIARLQPGVDSTRGITALRVIQGRLASLVPEDADWTSIMLYPLESEIVGEVSPQLRVLAGASLLIWFLVCLNVASLAVARRISRAREMAVRIALGATRGRLAWQAVVEGLLLALGGGALGLLIAAWVVGLLRSASIPGLPRAEELGMDARVVAVAVVLAVLTGLVSSTLPALRATGLRSADTLRGGRMVSTGGSLWLEDPKRVDGHTVRTRPDAPHRRWSSSKPFVA
jgi:putative ABC transport system permease protein